MARELIIQGRGNLPEGKASTIGPEYRKYLKEQHPDDYATLLNLEAEHAEANPLVKPQNAVLTTGGQAVKEIPATPAQQQKEETQTAVVGGA